MTNRKRKYRLNQNIFPHNLYFQSNEQICREAVTSLGAMLPQLLFQSEIGGTWREDFGNTEGLVIPTPLHTQPQVN